MASSVTFVINNVFATQQGSVPAAQLDSNFSNILNAVSGIALAQRDLGVLRGFLGGLTLSNDAGSPNTVLDVAAGVCASDDQATLLSLGAFTGSTAGTFVAGTGANKLDAGAIGNNQWWHVFVIGDATGTTVDILFSLSATAPTLPSGFTKQKRRGSFRTNGAAAILPFIHGGFGGRLFQWRNPTTLGLDISSGANPGTAAITRTLNVPTGVNVLAMVNVLHFAGATRGPLYLSDLATTDVATADATTPLGNVQAHTSVTSGVGTQLVRTNTSAQIRARLGFSDGSVQYWLQTIGWIEDL